MNSFVLASVLLMASSAMAQYRPFYAGSGVQYPRPFNSGGDADDGLGNRGGFGEAVTSRVDAYGHDTKLIEDANNYPEDRKPFWLLNRNHIITHLGLTPPSAQAAPAAPAASAVPAAQPAQSAQVAQPTQPILLSRPSPQAVQTVQPAVFAPTASIVDLVQPVEVHPLRRSQ